MIRLRCGRCYEFAGGGGDEWTAAEGSEELLQENKVMSEFADRSWGEYFSITVYDIFMSRMVREVKDRD